MFVGANGTGKSNLYREMMLLQDGDGRARRWEKARVRVYQQTVMPS